METPELTFLTNPTVECLQRAVALNHLRWLSLLARAGGGEVRQAEGMTWTYAPPPFSDGTVLFPELTDAEAGELLDEMVSYYLDKRPEKLVGCWSLYPTQPEDLEVRLLARGFQLGWWPHWMWLALANMKTEHATPDGLRVEIVEAEPVWEVDDLPYYSQTGMQQLHGAKRLEPERVWHFGAWLDGKLVGHSTLFLTTGELGIGGIYGCGVVPEARGQGIGKAVTLAACQQAHALGCPIAMLNATGMGEPMYRRLGFESVGHGRTWWLNVERLAAHAPTPTQIILAEAVGRGDIDTLNAIAPQLTGALLNTPIPCGMTLVELALHTNKPESVEWLVKHGATLDVVSAWRLGWKARAAQVLAETPALANYQSSTDRATPLHVAAAENDLELAGIVLTANPDLAIDNDDAGTALHQACWFGYIDMVRLILQDKPPLDARSRYDSTPLGTAIYGSLHCRNPKGDYPAVVSCLIDAGSPLPKTVSGSEAVQAVLRERLGR